MLATENEIRKLLHNMYLLTLYVYKTEHLDPTITRRTSEREIIDYVLDQYIDSQQPMER